RVAAHADRRAGWRCVQAPARGRWSARVEPAGGMMAAHAILQPSSAARWVACTGSVKLEALYPEDTESEKAREGTAAHWALAEVLNGRAVAEGQLTDDDFMLTREICEASESLLRHVQALCAEHGEQ